MRTHHVISANALVAAGGFQSGDLRASLVAQQRQLDNLINQVAGVLSSMHAEALGEERFEKLQVDLGGF